MFLLAIETLLKLRLNSNYNAPLMNKVFTCVILVLVAASVIVNFIFLCSLYKASPIFFILLNSMISFFIITTWMYIVIKIRNNQLEPESGIEKNPRRVHFDDENTTSNHDKGLDAGTTKITKSILKKMKKLTWIEEHFSCHTWTCCHTCHTWTLSAPALILITYIPFAFVPSIVRLATDNNLSAVGQTLLSVLSVVNYICDGVIYYYYTPGARRRIKEKLS